MTRVNVWERIHGRTDAAACPPGPPTRARTKDIGNGVADCHARTHGRASTSLHAPEAGLVDLDGRRFYRITSYDDLPPFFMTLVGASDLWLFISSTGGVTAGREEADRALFPYATEDKVAAGAGRTGGLTLLRVATADGTVFWQPFAPRRPGDPDVERHLYKDPLGTTLVFEETRPDLGLRVRVTWRTAARYGVVREVEVASTTDRHVRAEVLDGFVDLLPAGVTVQTQGELSSLLDAYKRAEVDAATGLGLVYLNSTLTDKADPSESLSTTVAWQVGLDDVDHLLSVAPGRRVRDRPPRRRGARGPRREGRLPGPRAPHARARRAAPVERRRRRRPERRRRRAPADPARRPRRGRRGARRGRRGHARAPRPARRDRRRRAGHGRRARHRAPPRERAVQRHARRRPRRRVHRPHGRPARVRRPAQPADRGPQRRVVRRARRDRAGRRPRRAGRRVRRPGPAAARARVPAADVQPPARRPEPPVEQVHGSP